MNTAPVSAVPHLEALLAACHALGAVITEAQVSACYESRNCHGTPSFRYVNGESTYDNDVTEYTASWPAERRFDSALGMHRDFPTGPTFYEIANAAGVELDDAWWNTPRGSDHGDQIGKVTLWRHALTEQNGNRHEGIVLAICVAHPMDLFGSRRQQRHFATNREGRLEVAMFA